MQERIRERLDQELAEISAMAEALLFIQEEAGDGRLDALRGVNVALLYIMMDKLRAAERFLAAGR